MSRNEITNAAAGKRVVDSNGNDIGVVSRVRDGTPYVQPEPGLSDAMRSKLGWGHVEKDAYPLASSEVQTVTSDEIRIT
ncbi:PRC-barrel domain containing protein [Halobacterium zhouii]|uniref:PRC-barrel domain containing protein n=1 Tax=Halobacterium zhouii TaxID=2902624 RepID=UPI001E4FAD70|nr:PRC-barrel domain containing protein [Halobacterium zhouii]